MKTLDLKIASVSCNQTAGDWPGNLERVFAAIDEAIADQVDILSFEELTLSGYDCGDNFRYTDQSLLRTYLQWIADYTASRDPNLVLSIGHPWYFSDPHVDSLNRAKDPRYNRQQLNFNVQTVITQGEVIAMSAKRYLFNEDRGYEKRYFQEWDDACVESSLSKYASVVWITLPEMVYPQRLGDPTVLSVPAKSIPFGSPVIQIGTGQRAIHLFHEICEGLWVAYDHASDEGYPLANTARDYALTVVLNPTASPPAFQKFEQQMDVVKKASHYADVVVMTDGLGSSGGTFAQLGTRLMAQKGAVIGFGKRVSFKSYVYSSQVVSVCTLRSGGYPAHVVVAHDFKAPVVPGYGAVLASWDHHIHRAVEEELRMEALWLFDYLRKNRIQGIVQALSGGADSAYNAAKVRWMLALVVKEQGVQGFLWAMHCPSYMNEVLHIEKTQGVHAALHAMMSHLLTAVYLRTDHNSLETYRAARTLIEGGTSDDGEVFEGIGGQFHEHNIQSLVDDVIRLFTMQPDVMHWMHANANHALAYENIQARLRQVMTLLWSNVTGKIGMANPNLDECRNGYSTWGGDLHSGMISGNAHKSKMRELAHMQYLYEKGLQDDVPPMRSFYWVLKNKPSAELQPKNEAGEVTQFDEDQLGRTFEEMACISYWMLNDVRSDGRKNNPIEVFECCRAHPLFQTMSIAALHDKIRLSYERWAHAQYKIHGSPIACTYGENVDHQTSLRTPVVSAAHASELTALTIYCLEAWVSTLGDTFEQWTGGFSLEALMHQAWIDPVFVERITQILKSQHLSHGLTFQLTSCYAWLEKHKGQLSNLFGALATSRMQEAKRYRARLNQYIAQ